MGRIYKYHLRARGFFDSEAILGKKLEDSSPRSLCQLLKHVPSSLGDTVPVAWWHLFFCLH